MDIPREGLVWQFSKYELPRRTVQVFLDVSFTRIEITKYLIDFIVRKVYDKMNPTNLFSLRKIEVSDEGDLKVTDVVTFDEEGKDSDKRRK